MIYSILKITIIVSSVFSCFIFVTSKKARESGCTISLSNDIPDNEPLYLIISNQTAGYQLFTPKNQTSIIYGNLTLLCLGRRNNFLRNTVNVSHLLCNGNNVLESSETGASVHLRDWNCTKTIHAELKITNEKCANNNGAMYYIGYGPDNRSFLPIFKVCYNNDSQETHFTSHVINGAAIKYSIKESKRREFHTSGLNSNNNIRNAYNKRHQIQHFKSILGQSQNYFNVSMFLARGHLTPDADFIFPNFQLSTYFYVNTAPEFQVINSGNWLRIENIVRNLAILYKTDFQIHTGCYDILRLKNENGVETAIYLENNNYKIFVPKWFWKIVKNIKSDAAIVLITLNNPFIRLNEIVEFCPNVCKTALLHSSHFENIRKGYTFCCEVGQFKEVVQGLPSNISASYLLNFTAEVADL